MAVSVTMSSNSSYGVPHTENIPFALTEGKQISIDGVATPYADRFSLNLCEGPNLDTTTVLHFNPRFGQNQVVRTHHQGGNWGPEETQGAFPFYKGTPYNVRIEVKGHAFEIFVNNQFYCAFNHRLPKEMARFVYVAGDTSITRISFTEAMGPPIMNPSVPFCFPIPGGLNPGRRIHINGVPTFGDGFSVNTVCGPSFEANDVALHFNPRFNQNEVVRTHKQANNWGNEEKHQQFFPFVQNVPFEIILEVEPFGYRVLVNNQFYADFNHRIPCQAASHISVAGNVSISQVRFQ